MGDRFVGWRRIVPQQCNCRDDLARCAVAALRGGVANERLLHEILDLYSFTSIAEHLGLKQQIEANPALDRYVLYTSALLYGDASPIELEGSGFSQKRARNIVQIANEVPRFTDALADAKTERHRFRVLRHASPEMLSVIAATANFGPAGWMTIEARAASGRGFVHSLAHATAARPSGSRPDTTGRVA